MNYKKKYLKYKLKYLNLNKNKLRGGYGDATPSDIERTLELQLLGQETEALSRMQQELQDERTQTQTRAESLSPTDLELFDEEDIDALYETLSLERGLEDPSLLTPQQRRDAVLQAAEVLINTTAEQPNYTIAEQPNYTDAEQPNNTGRHNPDDNILTTLQDRPRYLMLSSIVGFVIGLVWYLPRIRR